MKKTWVALAVAGAFVAGTAQAQSSVTLYGLIDTYLEFASINGNSVNKLTAGGLNGSRWGLRGSEDLGGGWMGIFTLESGFNGDTGSIGQGGRLFGRTAFVGVQKDWLGSFKFGRQYAPIFYTQAVTDIDGYSAFSIPGNSFGVDGEMLRQDNQIRWETPTWAGFSAIASYAFGEVPENNEQGTRWGLHGQWQLGGFTLAGGYHWRGIDTAIADDFTSWTLGGSWKLGPFGIAGNWTQFELDNIGATPDAKWDQWSIGADWTLGAARFLAQFGETSNKTSGANGKESSFMAGADYNLSKRTKVYFRFAQTSDDGDNSAASGATPISWYGLGDITRDEKGRTIAFGLNHKF